MGGRRIAPENLLLLMNAKRMCFQRSCGLSEIGALFTSKRKMQNFVNRLYSVLNVVKKINRITQMDCKSRDESNEPN